MAALLLRRISQTFILGGKHELIKLRFVDFKEKGRKEEIAGVIEKKTASELVGMIGHIAIFYRQHKDAEKRTVHVPKR